MAKENEQLEFVSC